MSHSWPREVYLGGAEATRLVSLTVVEELLRPFDGLLDAQQVQARVDVVGQLQGRAGYWRVGLLSGSTHWRERQDDSTFIWK